MICERIIAYVWFLNYFNLITALGTAYDHISKNKKVVLLIEIHVIHKSNQFQTGLTKLNYAYKCVNRRLCHTYTPRYISVRNFYTKFMCWANIVYCDYFLDVIEGYLQHIHYKNATIVYTG